MIALIDYKAGNLTSVKKALATIGADVFVPQIPADLADVAGIIVPGVGHFAATRALDSEWIDAIDDRRFPLKDQTVPADVRNLDRRLVSCAAGCLRGRARFEAIAVSCQEA